MIRSHVFLVSLTVSAAVQAQGVSVQQAGKRFSAANVQIRAGQPVTFVNDDKVAHNVFAQGGSQVQDLGLQRPGQSSQIRFNRQGIYAVGCAIHPKMKMTVTVK